MLRLRYVINHRGMPELDLKPYRTTVDVQVEGPNGPPSWFAEDLGQFLGERHPQAEVELEQPEFHHQEIPYDTLKKRDEIFVEAMAEIKVTLEGKSDQPVGDIVEGCIKELREIP